jgi:hypothetical protein
VVQPTTPTPRRVVLTTAVFWVITLIVLVACNRVELRKEYFYDEAWRADVIRSMRPLSRIRETVKAPLPPLWVFILHTTSRFVPGRFASLRLQNLALVALLPALSGQFVRMLGNGSETGTLRRTDATVVGGCVAVGMAASLDSFGLATYLNDYSFQAALTVGVVALWYAVDQGWARAAWLIPAMILLALGSISGLFVLPALAIWLVTRRNDRRLRIVWLGLFAAGLASSILYLSLYRTSVTTTLTQFWADDVLRGGRLSLAATLLRMVRTGGTLLFPWSRIDHVGVLPGFAFLVLVIIGLVRFANVWRWLPITAATSWLVAVTASIVADWPMTAVRVNLPFLSLFMICASVAILHVGRLLARRHAVAFLVVATTAFTALHLMETPYQGAPGADHS